jgi:hypothetical protein
MALYVPSLGNLIAVATTWGLGALLLLIGTAVSGRSSAPEFRLVAGWGALCVVLTLWGVFLPWSLRIPAVALILAALAAQALPGRRMQRADWLALGRMLLVTLPLWAVMASLRPSQVDTFLNLLPNADYLVDYARLPAAWLPPSYSFIPAAPYDTQFLVFVGSLAMPDYPAAGMSLVNIMLRLVAGLAIARVLSRAGSETAPSWGVIALGMLLVTLLDPGFVPRFHFSAYGETPLAVTALLAACLFVEAQQAYAEGGAAGRVALALILVAMINTKQSGIGLVLALAGAAIIAGVAERGADKRRLLTETILVLVPAALIYGVWRYYVAHAGVAELEPLPLSAWNWAMLPAIVGGTIGSIAEKSVFFAAVVVAFAALPLMLRWQGWRLTTRFLAFFAATFVLYNGFILATYVVHFSPQMSSEAHSYFRYNTHLSLILMLALALVVCDLARQLWARPCAVGWAGMIAVALALVTPVALAERLRFDIEMPQPLVWDLAAELKPHLRDGDRLALLMPGDNGEIGRLLGDYLTSAPPRRRDLTLLRRDIADNATLTDAAAQGYDLALISCVPAGLYDLPPGEAALVRHDAGGWHKIAAWPYSAGIALSRWQRQRHWPALCR